MESVNSKKVVVSYAVDDNPGLTDWMNEGSRDVAMNGYLNTSYFLSSISDPRCPELHAD